MRRGRRFGAGLALACLLTLAANRTLAPQTERFLHYYHSLERADGRLRVWERLFYSLVLAATPEPPRGAGGPTAGPATRISNPS